MWFKRNRKQDGIWHAGGAAPAYAHTPSPTAPVAVEYTAPTATTSSYSYFSPSPATSNITPFDVEQPTLSGGAAYSANIPPPLQNQPGPVQATPTATFLHQPQVIHINESQTLQSQMDGASASGGLYASAPPKITVLSPDKNNLDKEELDALVNEALQAAAAVGITVQQPGVGGPGATVTIPQETAKRNISGAICGCVICSIIIGAIIVAGVAASGVVKNSSPSYKAPPPPPPRPPPPPPKAPSPPPPRRPPPPRPTPPPPKSNNNDDFDSDGFSSDYSGIFIGNGNGDYTNILDADNDGELDFDFDDGTTRIIVG